MADNKVPQKKCLSDDTAYKHTHFDVIDRSLLPPGTQAVPVLKKPTILKLPCLGIFPKIVS